MNIPDKLFGIDEQLAKVERFIREFKNLEKKAVILYGPPGVGKTTTAYYIAKKFGYKLIEINCSDQRTQEELKKLYVSVKTVGLQKKLFLLDELDGIAMVRGKDVRFPPKTIPLLKKILTETKYPIIITCNDINLIPDSIKELCELIEYRIVDRLAYIRAAQQLGIRITRYVPSFRQLELMAKGSMGYSMQSRTAKLKRYFATGVFDGEYTDDIGIVLLENVPKFLRGLDLYYFIEFLSIADLTRRILERMLEERGQDVSGSAYPDFKKPGYILDGFKFPVYTKDAADYVCRFFEKLRLLKESEKGNKGSE